MSEKLKFSSVNWTVSTDLIRDVEVATSDACYIGNFVRSNLTSNEALGVTSFDVYEASIKSYAKFCSVLERANQRLRAQKAAGTTNPDGTDLFVATSENVLIPFELRDEIADEKVS